MKLLVVGPGAMGTLFSGMLSLGGHEVWLLGRRPEVIEAIDREGVTIVRGETRQRVAVRATVRAQEVGPAELVLVFVKAYDTLQACKDALPAVGADTVVLTLQNGLNNVETIASVVGRERVLAGVTAHGATLLGPGLVRHGGEGETAIGELGGRVTERLERVAGAFRQAAIEVVVSRAVSSLIWGKLVVNAAINPVTALLRVPNGQLLGHPETRALMEAVATEVAAVAQARGVVLPYDDPWESVETVCRRTASNRSSMLQDVERGIQTEIDYINGAVAREGELLGVPTPVNWTLTQLVSSLPIVARPHSPAR
ncbi:MAG: ketopantoate reductase family protein [Chloroflexota bacterium]